MAPGERATLGLGLISLICFSWAALWKLVGAAEAAPIRGTGGLLAPDRRRDTDVGEGSEEGEGHGAKGRHMGPGQGQLFPPSQPWLHGQEGSSASVAARSEAWPLPSLLSLPKRLLALMRNPVISPGEKTSNRKSSRLSLSFALSGGSSVLRAM